MEDKPHKDEEFERIVREDLEHTGMMEDVFEQWDKLGQRVAAVGRFAVPEDIRPMQSYAQAVQAEPRLDDELKAMVLANSNAEKVAEFDRLVVEFNEQLPAIVAAKNRDALKSFTERARQLKVRLL